MFRVFVICVAIGLASAQRGHYAGGGPILGSRYQNQDSNTGSRSDLAAKGQEAPVVQQPVPQPAQPVPVAQNNRIDSQQQQQQPGGFGNFPQNGFPQGGFGHQGDFNNGGFGHQGDFNGGYNGYDGFGGFYGR